MFALQYDEIPVEATGRNPPQPINSFTDINLGRILTENIKSAGYVRPTPVQKYALPIVLNERDLMACAQTGSGKTAAFLFPIISKLVGGSPAKYDYTRRKAFPHALVQNQPTTTLTFTRFWPPRVSWLAKFKMKLASSLHAAG